jgi:hypothetical protein
VAPAAARVRAGSWRLLPAAPVTKPLDDVVSVWTGHEMIIHGIGFTAGGPRRVTFAYRPATRTWVKLPRGPRPAVSEGTDIGVWTGSEMLVLGPTAGAYNPATNSWRQLARSSLPDGGAVTGWTGSQEIVWGGTCCDGRSHDGEAYDPATDTWTKLPTAPLQVRRGAMGAWTGRELVVAGGVVPVSGSRFRFFRNAAAYNPVTRSWRKLPPMPRRRADGTAVWDGKEILFIGGIRAIGGLPAARGMAYNPATNHWRQLPAMKFRRSGFAAVWTGRRVLVWGGLAGHFPTWVPPPRGEAYNPATSKWTWLPKAPLHGRAGPTAVWTGHRMIVWGGSVPRALRTRSFIDGAAYTPRKP